MPGVLYVVATPIGNLEDLTFRALRTLREVDLIAAEDTRRTAKLLAHYEIRKPMTPLHEHNEVRDTPKLIARLSAGESIALVSDAGTPGISDPGARLVAAAHEAQIKVVPIPGPSAVAAALSASGFSASQFVFLGYLPRSGQARIDALDQVTSEPRVAVIFEAPHRIQVTLAELAQRLADRPIRVFREITKQYEELVLRPNSTNVVKAKGEFTIVIDASSEATRTGSIDEGLIQAVVDYLTNKTHSDRELAIKGASAALRIPESLAKKAWKRARGYGG
jgi:16S rRNA (cytidine1402-2'-O)-methyltransferase